MLIKGLFRLDEAPDVVSLKSSRANLIRKILLTVDQQPSSIYDILHSITEFSDPKRTRLPKLLKNMENDNLVVSALQPGPLGPYRRIYEPGPDAEEYLIESLRNALETVLHFYDSFRKSNDKDEKELNREEITKSGKILYVAYPQMDVNDLNEIRDLSVDFDVEISIIGPDEILQKTGISYEVVGESLEKIESEGDTFTEIYLRGIPPKLQFSDIITECKRVLVRGGILHITSTFVFFDKPKRGSLEEFIRQISVEQFPELGIAEGNFIEQILEENFTEHGTDKESQGQYRFWAVKT